VVELRRADLNLNFKSKFKSDANCAGITGSSAITAASNDA
jgi:hypothetical protein